MTFLACAALLASACMFTACKKDKTDEELQQATQEGSYNGETVKTQFSIALPNQVKAGPNRMPGTTVQLPDAYDKPQFQGMTGITLIPYAKQLVAPAEHTPIAPGDKRIGDNIYLTEGVAKTELGTNSNAKVFDDVSIPLSTASFLFYATSSATGTKFQTGSLVPTNLADNAKQLEDITFGLEKIQSDPAALMLPDKEGGKLMAYLTSVANATDGVKAWSAYTITDNEALKKLYDSFISIHGLSSFEVARIMTDLYKSLKPVSSPIATAIKTAISDGAKNVSAEGVVTLKDDQLEFPQKYDLPEGSIETKWDADGKKFTTGDYTGMASPEKYVYPAQLWYYMNSAIKTSNQSRQTMYDNVNDWAAILGAHIDGQAVSARTRAVAITDPIQYAVARLDVKVRLASAAMKDNSDNVEGSGTDVDCTVGFPVTAVLVGGQQQVKYDFTTNGGTEYTIYDNVMTNTIKAEKDGDNYSAANSTLVLENGTSDVQIAVEMVNDKADFYGAGNQLIPKDSKFYVVAKLTASAATETGSHVFKQDYTTTAKLTLQNLRNAYNTIPDLRTPQLELGFSVDLTWQNGHEYILNFD